MTDALHDLAERVRLRSGIRLRPSQSQSLLAAMRRVGGGDHARTLHELSEPRDGPALIDELIDELTVKETFFLREQAQLERIEWRRLLANALRRGASGIRVWSAACATGEEPYTLAMLAHEALGSSGAPVSVLGSDVSRTALAAAERAHYKRRAVRLLDPALLNRHFVPRDGGFTPRPALRDGVRFTRHNLARDPQPPAGGPFDLVVCRNVLIYFEPSAVEHAIRVLRESLAPGGMLLLGTADRLCAPQVPGPRGPAERRHRVRRRQKRPRVATRRDGERRRTDRRAPGPHPAPSLALALSQADSGDLERALVTTDALLAKDPMDSAALYVRGLAQLAAGDAAAAAASLRSARYADPDFALAAFTLGRAHDALGDAAAARRAYEQALRSFDPDLPGPPQLLGAVDIGDVAAACRARLATLSPAAA